jgi:hypothetical protein|nr:MAG TPA: hypothetical protein [Bacteriophage sp.]
MTTTNVKHNDFEVEQRSAEYLIDHEIPYSEMSEAELQSVIDLKAEWKAAEAEHQAVLEQNNQALQQIIADNKAAAEKSNEVLQNLVSAALFDYEQSVKEANKQ